MKTQVPIYVDWCQPAVKIPDHMKHLGNLWCHLWCDVGNEAYLIDFAIGLGLRRGWFQDKKGFPHFDLTPNMRKKAVENGAIRTSLRSYIAARMMGTCLYVEGEPIRTNPQLNPL